MANSRSIAGAIVARFEAMTFANQPNTLWFGDAPLRNPDQTPVDFPLASFYQEPAGDLFLSSGNHPFLVQEWFRFECWATTLEVCIDVYLGLLFGGSAPTAGGGFFTGGTLTFAANSFVFKDFYVPQWPSCEGLNNPRDGGASRVYKATFRLRVQAEWVGG